MNSRKTIGLFFEGLADKYQAGILKGIKEQVICQDINLICFPGKHINSTNNFDYMANILYRITCKNNINGLIILSSTIFQFLSKSEILEFCKSYSHIPIISVGLQVPDIHNIVVESKYGIEQLFSHLIDFHGYKNFVFIKGPEGHEEADFRFNTFKSILKKYSITLQPENIIKGNFLKGSGIRELHKLLTEKKQNIDVIAAANDNMAIGVINDLRKMGINVPVDIAVTGFDNIIESRYITPPLTTINQPLMELGKDAVQLLMKLLNNEEIPYKTKLQSKLVIRQSCGCFSRRVNQIFQFKKESLKALNEINISNLYKIILKELQSSYQYSYNIDEIGNNIKKLLKCLKSDIKTDNFPAFILLINDLLQSSFFNRTDIAFWNDVILIVHKNVLYCLNTNEQLKAESIFEQAYILISEAVSRQEAFKRVQEEQHYQRLQIINAELITAFDIQQLLRIIGKGVLELDISRFFVVLYDNKNIHPEWSRLHLAVMDEDIKIPGSRGIRFPTKELLPSTFVEKKNRYTFILNALYLKEEQLGYIISKVGPDDPLVYLSLRDQISSAIKGADLMLQIKSHTDALEQQVAKRTIELKRVNERLLADIEKRKYLEKEIIEISSKEQKRIGQDLHDDLCQSIAGISVFASALGDRLKRKNIEDANSAYKLSGMMNDALEQTKKIVRGLYPTLLSDSLKSALNDLALRMAERYKIPIELEIKDTLKIPESVSIHLYRIAQEAISNALKHADADTVKLSLNKINKKIVLRIIDDGRGLSEHSIREHGIGLDIMQYRANIINGTFSIRRNGEKGTIITCIV